MLKVGFFGQSGPYAPVALRELLAGQGDYRIALCVEGLKLGSPRGEIHELRKIKPGVKPEAENLTEIASFAGVPVFCTSNVNAAKAVGSIGSFGLDWIVCVGFDRLFSEDILKTARRGGINAHPSRLPLWRGPAPIFWALRQGLHCSALSLHALDNREDHGPVFMQEPFSWPSRSRGADIYRIAGQLAGEMLVRALRQASLGTLAARTQDHTLATRAPRPKPEDAQIIPSEWGCEHVVDFACGSEFFRAAWLRFGEDVFFCRRGLKAEIGRSLAGEYILSGSTLIVACRDGLAHLEIQV